MRSKPKTDDEPTSRLPIWRVEKVSHRKSIAKRRTFWSFTTASGKQKLLITTKPPKLPTTAGVPGVSSEFSSFPIFNKRVYQPYLRARFGEKIKDGYPGYSDAGCDQEKIGTTSNGSYDGEN